MRANARYFAALGFEFEYVSAGREDARGGDVGGEETWVLSSVGCEDAGAAVERCAGSWGKRRTADAWRRIAENGMEIVAGHRRLFKEGFGRVYASLNWEL